MMRMTFTRNLRAWWLALALCAVCSFGAALARAQEQEHGTSATEAIGGDHAGQSGTGSHEATATGGASGDDSAHGGSHGGSHAEGGHGEGHGAGHSTSPFDPHAGTWINPIVRAFTGAQAPKLESSPKNPAEKHVDDANKVRYDYFAIALGIMATLGLVGSAAGRKAKLRPEGKPTSIDNLFEAAAEGFQNYLIGIMGRDLALKYTPLIATFFLTIIFSNWMGLVPGMIAPTSNANVPLGLALVAFVATHVIAIREVGVGSWFMHFVGEPKWLGFLNFPLHLIGEIIKPVWPSGFCATCSARRWSSCSSRCSR
jgi:hypothetical protein